MQRDDPTSAPETQAAGSYKRAVAENPEARAFIAANPEFSPHFDPNKKKQRKRNQQGRRLTLHLVDPAALQMVRNLTHRTNREDHRGRFSPIDPDAAFRSAEDEALDNVESPPNPHDGLATFFRERLVTLRQDHRELLEWSCFDQLSQRQMADKLGCNQSTVSRKLATARKAFVDSVASIEGPLPMVPSGGRPKRDADATQQQADRILRALGLLHSPDPFGGD